MAGALDPSLLDQPVTALAGAGPVTAARLAERGLESVRDLLGFLPIGYQDFRTLYPLSALAGLPAGQAVVVRALVRRVRPFFRRLLDVYLEQDGVQVRARWFRPNPGMVKTYAKGNLVALAGCLRRAKDGAVELIHPRNVTALMPGLAGWGGESGLGLRPRYPQVEKVPGRVVEKLVAAAVEQAAGLVPDVLPQGVAKRLDFPSIADSLRQIHQPDASLSRERLAELLAGQAPAQRRLAFEDLFVVQVGLARERDRARHATGWRCEVDGEAVLASARAALPFVLTAGQQSAIRTLYADLGGPTPMQRMLQGDVGSGKTAVAFAAALLVGRAGGQSLLMAPTEVLAEQHGRTLTTWGGKADLRVGVLHAGLDTPTRRRVLAAVATGAIDLLVGTHALLEAGLRVRRMALAIVDEQHRFGVRQRAALRRAGGWISDEKTGMVPHLLVLSATPIPRSLALTAYGDLDLITLAETPPGRQVVATHLGVGEAARREAWAAVRTAVAAGGQGFVVCPAIVEQKQGRRASVLSRFRELRPLLAPARVGLLHGQMPSTEQQEVVAAFRAGKIDVLVATTVLEVGVDVARASIIVIEDAERFGLVLGVEPELDCTNPRSAMNAMRAAEFVVALSAYRGRAAEYAHVLLPIAPFTETSGSFVNAEGRLQGFNGVVRPLGEARPAWKVLRVLGNLAGLARFEYDTSEQVRDETCAPDAVAARLDNRVSGLELGPEPQPAGGLQRIADVPIYFADPVVRRAASLQKTRDAQAPRAWVNPALAAKLGVAAGAKVKVRQEGGEAILELAYSDRLPAECVRIAAAHPSTATLGTMFGEITSVEQA